MEYKSYILLKIKREKRQEIRLISHPQSVPAWAGVSPFRRGTRNCEFLSKKIPPEPTQFRFLLFNSLAF
jgi:hypothetical protein